MQCPIITCTQKINMYETKARYYVVGSNNIETRFRILKIDRTEPKELHITDDKIIYTRKEVRDLLLMIDMGNRPKQQQKSTGLSRSVSAFGIVGFVRFLEGHYIVLITKRKKVAVIATHTIYKVEDTTMVYIPNGDTVRYPHPDEQRYVKMFQNVDLSSNFYFSYSYDLTHTLQYNLQPCKGLQPAGVLSTSESQASFWQADKKESSPPYDILQSQEDVEDASKSVGNLLEGGSKADLAADGPSPAAVSDSPASSPRDDFVYGVRTEPTARYVWNSHLLRPTERQVHPDWVLHITHGFIGQSNISVFGRSMYLTVLARRSNQFAGTRFLKRGSNAEGNVANEVETEQIVQNAAQSDWHRVQFTSFVQHRGSIPGFWSQDISKMVPKPPIILDQSDPYGHIAGQHFNQVLKRYGAPVIILNLVKKREKRRHESLLSEEVVSVLRYLNQFLPAEHSIKYIGFDMARYSKSKSEDVLKKLSEIAAYCVKKTGFFQSGSVLHCNRVEPHPRYKGMAIDWEASSQRQRGVVRTNCVDCLDRTNTAQFAIGKCALAFQLHALGVLDCPHLEFDSDCVRMLEDLYEDQGDTLALQYGGSQLVHRIKGYRKIAPWTSSSRDIMQTLSRYYSNAFSDAEKQHAMNLFLGVFEPREGKPNIWELPTDFYLHNAVALRGPRGRERSYSQWWETPVMQSLPYASEEEFKGLENAPLVIRTHATDQRVNGFWDFYKPYELTSLDAVFTLSMPKSIRDFMPKFANDFSPFVQRVQPGRRQAEYGVVGLLESNPNVSGKDSTMSTTSTGSEGSTSSSDGSDVDGDIDVIDENSMPKDESGLTLVSLKDLCPTMAQTYGVEIREPEKHNVTLYKRYGEIGQRAMAPPCDKRAERKATDLVQRSIFSMDSSFSVEPPKVTHFSREVYETYQKRGQQGAKAPNMWDLRLYQEYLKTK